MSYFYHNFKNIHCYIMSEVSLKKFYFALFDGTYFNNFGVYRLFNSNSSNVVKYSNIYMYFKLQL